MALDTSIPSKNINCQLSRRVRIWSADENLSEMDSQMKE